jgi:hypothetical protein
MANTVDTAAAASREHYRLSGSPAGATDAAARLRGRLGIGPAIGYDVALGAVTMVLVLSTLS